MTNIILMTSRPRQGLIVKPLIIVVGIGLVMMMTLSGVVSMVSAQQSGKKGIASIQNGKKGMPLFLSEIFLA
jgi:hypothetical protein